MRVSLPVILGCGWVALAAGCNDTGSLTGFDPTDPVVLSSGGESSSTGATGGSTGAPTTSTSGPGETTGATAGSTGAGSTTMSGMTCSIDQDCKDSPDGPICDPETKTCTTPCAAGAEEACYAGPPGTEDVGACKPGTRTCLPDGSGFGPCEGAVEPVPEVCANTVDDNCDGVVDEDTDADGDGWGVCSGDCCDADGGSCFDPELVNPGAYEFVGNTVDDDCDGKVDEAATTCDGGLASDTADALNFARAIDLCQFTTENPPDPKDRRWGVISAKFSLADGTGTPSSVSRAIRPDFGDVIKPQKAKQMAVLSSGHAASQGDTLPPFAAFEQGVNTGTTSPPPQDWWAKIGGKLPNPPGCAVPMLPSANDPVMLKLRVRVPTNAKSFSAKMYFFSAEYPEYVCSQYNDFFVALVDSLAVGNPDDKNVAVFDDGKTKWPIGVNLVKVATGLFTQCQGGTVGCKAGVPTSQYAGCKTTAELKGTGFDLPDADTCAPGQTIAGGGTGWLTLRGNVAPGEVMEIRFAIWDTGGHIFDSLVLLDAWEWSLDAAQPGVTPG